MDLPQFSMEILPLFLSAVILMGAFGPTDSIFATLLSPVFFAFGASTAGTTIHSDIRCLSVLL